MALKYPGISKQFQAGIKRLAANLRQNEADAVKTYSEAYLTALVPATPIDTGLARANWQTAFQKNESTVPVTTDSVAAGKAVIAQYARGKRIYIFNNLPYIQRLNEGWSKQAPAGFVEMARARVKGILSNVPILRKPVRHGK